MSDREILLAWKGGTPLRIFRDEKVYLIADRETGNGGWVRCVRMFASDAPDQDVLAELKALTEDLLIAEVQFPPHLAKLGKLSHGV